MALNSMGLGFVFTARDLASAKMQRLERRFTSLDQRVGVGADRMNTAFRQLGVGLAIFTAGAAAVGGALALANAAGRFEQGLPAIGAVTRATTRELGMLREAAINAGIEERQLHASPVAHRVHQSLLGHPLQDVVSHHPPGEPALPPPGHDLLCPLPRLVLREQVLGLLVEAQEVVAE